MSKININGVELELDLLDADAMEIYQKALNETTAAIQKAQSDVQTGNSAQGLQVAESMRLQCQLTETFIDQVFGEGTAKKCFPRPNHLGDHLEAFTKVCEQANLAVKQAKDITSKYSGNRIMNRQQRRQNRKNHGAAVYPAK